MFIKNIFNDIAEDKKKYFVKTKCSNEYYAIGKNNDAIRISKKIKLIGIVDDINSSKEECWEGIPIISSADADKNICIVNCSTSIRPIETVNYLKNKGFQKIITLFDLYIMSGDKSFLPDFVQEQEKDFYFYPDEWERVFKALIDDESKKTFLDIFKFRLTANINYLKDYKIRLSDQYFENFMDYKEEVFIDAGGFDGDTSEIFLRKYPDYRKIIIFEPSLINIEKAKCRLAGFRDIYFYEVGLSDKKEVLSFNSNLSSASSIAISGEDLICVDSLDNLIQEPATFIKMDLEGWELPAIKGAKKHISKFSPKMALAAYHKASDAREFYSLINSYNKNYDIFFRHYTQGWSESVLFFKPK